MPSLLLTSSFPLDLSRLHFFIQIKHKITKLYNKNTDYKLQIDGILYIQKDRIKRNNPVCLKRTTN